MNDKRATLLLIENDPLSRPLYQRELSPHYAVVVCETEAQVWATLANTQVDAIILEPANGNEWGWFFVDKLKQDEQGKQIPVIFCTVLDERKRGLQQGASAYLVKPVYANVLRHHVQEVLEKRRNQEVVMAKSR